MRKAKEVPHMLTMPSHLEQRLEQVLGALKNYQQDLEGLESELLRFEEALLELEEGALNESVLKHQNGRNSRLLSIPEVCLRLGSDRSSVYRRLRSGDIPSLKLGHAMKVRKSDLEKYMKAQRSCRSLSEENSFVER